LCNKELKKTPKRTNHAIKNLKGCKWNPSLFTGIFTSVDIAPNKEITNWKLLRKRKN
jgi:hypothetical protein